MKKLLFISAILVVALLSNLRLVTAQDKKEASKYEYAIVKWDGPDRLYYNLPDKFEMVHITKGGGVRIPNEAQEVFSPRSSVMLGRVAASQTAAHWYEVPPA